MGLTALWSETEFMGSFHSETTNLIICVCLLGWTLTMRPPAWLSLLLERRRLTMATCSLSGDEDCLLTFSKMILQPLNCCFYCGVFIFRRTRLPLVTGWFSTFMYTDVDSGNVFKTLQRTALTRYECLLWVREHLLFHWIQLHIIVKKNSQMVEKYI